MATLGSFWNPRSRHPFIPRDIEEMDMVLDESATQYGDLAKAYAKLIFAKKRLKDAETLRRNDRKRRTAYEYHRRAKAEYGKAQSGG
jgi:hypothetical protein